MTYIGRRGQCEARGSATHLAREAAQQLARHRDPAALRLESLTAPMHTHGPKMLGIQTMPSRELEQKALDSVRAVRDAAIGGKNIVSGTFHEEMPVPLCGWRLMGARAARSIARREDAEGHRERRSFPGAHLKKRAAKLGVGRGAGGVR